MQQKKNFIFIFTQLYLTIQIFVCVCLCVYEMRQAMLLFELARFGMQYEYEKWQIMPAYIWYKIREIGEKFETNKKVNNLLSNLFSLFAYPPVRPPAHLPSRLWFTFFSFFVISLLPLLSRKKEKNEKATTKKNSKLILFWLIC